MPALFKNRKKRDSQQKPADDTSSAASQRSPSSTSHMSADSPMRQGQSLVNGLGNTASGLAGTATNGLQNGVNGLQNGVNGLQTQLNGATSGLTAGSHQATSAVNEAANGVHNSINSGLASAGKTLNSPFLGNQAKAVNGELGQINQHVNQHGNHGNSQRNQLNQQLNQQQLNQQMSPQYQQQQQPLNQQQRQLQGQQSPQTQLQQQQLNQQRNSPSSQSALQQNQSGLQQSPQQNSPFPGSSDTPWAEYAIQRAAPSPRFGHSANYLAARDGELFIMGGIRDMDILNDLWVIDTKTLTGYQLVTDGYKVGPRVGHASLVLGNAHVVFGGDTKIDESDPLDDNLYLLNTSSLKWTVAQPQGPRPSGRYGHSLSNVGARVYVFGGQVDEEFYDDMWAFDLTTWRSPSAKWELIQPATPPPPPRTNHTVVTYEDKLYLFGGANGDLWYSDTWVFDPATRVWEQLECSGYVPAPCQGHAATIIGDVMYVFGGMSSQGLLIDQLFALKLSTLKWYTFQNLGPGPSPRSGHSLTAFGGDKVLVWGGTDQGNSAYVLDVSRINYPDDHPTPNPNSPAVNSPAMNKTPSIDQTTSPVNHKRSTSNASGDGAAADSGSGSAGVDSHAPEAAVAAAGAAAAGAAGAAGAALGAAKHENSSTAQAQNALSPSRDSPLPPTPEGRSSGPVTTKEVRELQPHVYAPQSIETKGPTQAKSNSAARNSMLFSKRRSVLMPSSPTKSLSDYAQQPPAGTASTSSSSSTHQPLNLAGTGANGDSSSNIYAAPSLPDQDTHTRSPNRESAQVKSYVTEGDMESADERFVSAVDLADPQDSQAPKIHSRARGHSRGLSFGINPAVPEESERSNTLTAENNEQFRKMEAELEGMPGGFSNNGLNSVKEVPSEFSKPEQPTSDSITNRDVPSVETSMGSISGTVAGLPAGSSTGVDLASLRSDESIKSGLNGWNSTHGDGVVSDAAVSGAAAVAASAAAAGVANSSSSNKPGLRRSQPQTNLSLHNIDEADSSNTSSAGANVIGLSDEMSAPSNEANAQLYNRENNEKKPNADISDSAASDAATIKHADDNNNNNSNNNSNPPSVVSRSVSAGSVNPSDQVPTLTSSPKAERDLPKVPSPRKSDVLSASSSVPSNSSSAGSGSRDISGGPSSNLTSSGSGGSSSGNYSADFDAASAAAEIAALRKQVNEYRQRDFNDEFHQLRQSHAQQQRELTNLRDANAQLSRKHTALTSQNSDLKQRHDHMADVVDGHVDTLKQQQQALDDANRKLSSQQDSLTQLSILQSENADLKLKLKTAEANERHAKEQLEALNNSYAALKSAHSDLSARHLAASGSANKDKDGNNGLSEAHSQLSNNVSHLVSLWENFKLNHRHGSNPSVSKDINSGMTEDYKLLYETQKDAADRAQQELQKSYAQQSDMKAQLREISSLYASSHSEADMDLLKQQHRSALSSLDTQHQSTLRELKEHTSSLEDLRARLSRVESSYSELQAEYSKAIDLSRNQQAALTKTREELNMSRAHAQRLEEQLEDASLQNTSTHASLTGDNIAGDMSHTSVNSSRNDQATLVIRDLRAQIVILEEEITEQRQQVMTLKKQALTKNQI